MNRSDDSIPISALQHWLFCPRQCALIHVERLWAENRFTAEGRVLHERADGGGQETRGSMQTLRSVQLGHAELGIHGVADVVEMRGAEPYPVEYKRGRPKDHRADEVQLCAQGLCLEEMTGRAVPEGALFYGKNRRRKIVAFDIDLRNLVAQTALAIRETLESGKVPPPLTQDPRCNACSLYDLCHPERMAAPPVVSDWMRRHAARAGVPE